EVDPARAFALMIAPRALDEGKRIGRTEAELDYKRQGGLSPTRTVSHVRRSEQQREAARQQQAQEPSGDRSPIGRTFKPRSEREAFRAAEQRLENKWSQEGHAPVSDDQVDTREAIRERYHEYREAVPSTAMSGTERPSAPSSGGTPA